MLRQIPVVTAPAEQACFTPGVSQRAGRVGAGPPDSVQPEGNNLGLVRIQTFLMPNGRGAPIRTAGPVRPAMNSPAPLWTVRLTFASGVVVPLAAPFGQP